ncbi:MAG: carboxypeptidase regulatory-like domain-containing protein [Anaerotignum sp.]|nr:carboxypeptidase regulatory-like domain-containing protein [Anaerotignum sp.]
MVYKELYNLGYSPTFEVNGREEKTENLNLAANPSASAGILSGTVTSGGSGLAGATVKVYDVNDNPIEHTNTGGNGQFTIANLPVGSYKVTAIKAGYLLPLTTPISIQQNKTTSVDINLTADPDNNLNVVYGIIRTTEDETPLENAVVSLYSNILPDPILVISTTTNDNGEFIFGLIPTGEYYVTASKLGYYTNESAIIDLTTKEFVSSEISLIADSAANTGTVSGFIKELATGQPIAGAGVALYSVVNGVENVVATTRTNVSGKYLFANVNPGTYLVKSTKQEEVD